MKERWHTLANAILNGEPQSVAYARIYGVKPETARPNSTRLLQNPDFVALLESLREARQMDDEAIRAEIVAGHLADIRNESLPVADRRAARVALGKVCGLELSKAHIKVETSPADALIMEQMRLCEIAMEREQEKRLERGRRIKPLEADSDAL